MVSADPLVWPAVLALMVGAIGGSTPLWRSARLSPDSIQRRTYWLCCALVIVFGFASQLPNIPGALFVAGASALVLIGIAVYWTNHLKINGRVYAASARNRRPDRPPAGDSGSAD